MLPPPLQIKSSGIAKQGVVVLFLAALLTAFCLPFWWCITALCLLSVQAYLLSRPRGSLDAMQILPDGKVQLSWKGGVMQQAEILPSSVLTAFVMALHLRVDGKRLAIVLWPDSADRQLLRQWRVWLLWEFTSLQRRLKVKSGKGVD